MNSKSEDEDYWHSSDSKAFSFDEEEFSYKSSLFDGGKGNVPKPFHSNSGNQYSTVTDLIFQGVSTVKSQEAIRRPPLGSLISKYSLNKIFEEETCVVRESKNAAEEEVRILRRQLNNQWIPQPACKTIKLIMTGQPYSFHLYRSLEQKTELLDEAVKSGDGNAILAVVLFLSNTLKKSIFYQLLQNRTTAGSQYIQYLWMRNSIAELIDLLMILGQSKEAAMRDFKMSVQGTQNLEIKLKKLNSCYQSHFSSFESQDNNFINSYINYLEWLSSISGCSSIKGTDSILTSLSFLCKNHWNEPKTNNLSPWFLFHQQNISLRFFHWTVLRSRASVKAWDDIEAFFFTKGWLGRKKMESILSAEKIVQELHRQGAPKNVLAQYLDVIDDLDTRLQISKQLPCHSVAIDIYVSMKDRQGLVEYKANLEPQSEDYIHAEIALKSPVKWKN